MSYVDIKIIYERLANSQGKRPLAKNFNSYEKLSLLFNKRRIFYEDADIELKITKLSKNSVLNLTYKKLYEYLERKNEKD